MVHSRPARQPGDAVSRSARGLRAGGALLIAAIAAAFSPISRPAAAA